MKTLLLPVLLLFCIHAARACVVISPERTISVTDRDTRKPIRDVKITLEEDGMIVWQGMTDSTGKFRFRGFHDTHRLRISHPEYLAFVTKLKLDYDYILQAVVQLSKTKRHLIHITETPVLRKVVIYKQASAPNTQADTYTDDCFNKLNCTVQHYSRKAVQEQNPATKILNKVLVYPNPVSGGVLYIESVYDSRKTLLVYNIAGTEVLRSEIVFHQTIDTSQFPPGIYFIKVIDEQHDDVTVKKIVVP